MSTQVKFVLLLSILVLCGCEQGVNAPDVSNHEYVDLGLSVKWATCNVGASSPEDYGKYFAWGETAPKTDYSWSTYKYCRGSYDTMTKYCTSSSFGTVDNKTTLELTDDAAHVNWGGSWRMPTKDEQDELRYNCTWTWTSNYNSTGVKGYIVSSKVAGNSNSIFLPAAGERKGRGLDAVGEEGNYWSSSVSTSGSFCACSLNFYSDNVYGIGNNRCRSRSVRPVCP